MNINSYLQALHGAFGIGALFGPLIIAPFLRKPSPRHQWHYAYWFIGSLHLPNSVWILFYAIQDGFHSKKTTEKVNLKKIDFALEDKPTESIIKSDDKASKSSEKANMQNLLTLILLTLLILLYVGGESAFGAFIHTYATLQLNFEKDIAAYLNSAFWASSTVSRLFGVLLSMRFSPKQLLTIDLICSMGAMALLGIVNKSQSILWIGSILFGTGIGRIYPSVIAFAEKEISITGRRMSFIAAGGSAGDAIIPLLIGYTMSLKSLGPISFILVVFVVFVLASLIFGLTTLYVKYQSKMSNIQNG